MDQPAYMLTPYLQALVNNNASDLHIKAGAVARIRMTGRLVPLNAPVLTPQDCERWIHETMPENVRDRFDRTNEADYAIVIPGLGRFRANAFRALGNVGMVARRVADGPQTMEQLGLPEVVGRLALEERGLVLVTGPTGSGKTTTLAAMVDLINRRRPVHIVTIEDPIEVLHTDQLAVVTQRELGADTSDWSTALRAAMRQIPDVILIGEMRDVDTVRATLTGGNSGHLTMSTLHTTSAAETVNRIIDFFPPHEQRQVRFDLAQSLKGVICQRLVPAPNGIDQVCVMEILVTTPRICEAIADPEKSSTITRLIAEGHYDGMQTFDQHLVALVRDGRIDVKTAKTAASQPHDISVQLKRAGISPAVVDAA